MDFLYTLFQSASGTNYMYDAAANRIFQVSELLYKHHAVLFGSLENKLNLLKLYKDADYENVLKEYAKLKSTFEQGLISPNSISGVDYPFTACELDNRLNTSLRHLVLGITENCNLRCEYCIYSGHYLRWRKHSDKTMSYHTAQKAIDFFRMRSVESPKIIISFYGGEPLLEFEKIKSLIEYCQSVFSDKEQDYQISSNGTLLNDEFINWFADKPNVYLNITLNGPEALHDRYRRTQGGSGSHRHILAALSAIYKKSPKAYDERVDLLCNYLRLSDIDGIMKFYDTEALLHGKTPTMLTKVYNADHDGFISALINKNTVGETEKSAYGKLAEMYCGGGFNQPILKLLFGDALKLIHKRQICASGGDGLFTGVCVLFTSNLFVSADGTFNLCEKAVDFLDFGNIEDGFNFARIHQLLSDYKNANEGYCKKCWAVRLCSACFNDTFAAGAVDTSRRGIKCGEIRNNLRSNLSLYCSMMEKSPSGLDFTEEHTFQI